MALIRVSSADDHAPTIASQSSSPLERRLAIGLVATLAIVSVAAVPFRLRSFGTAPAFISGFAGVTATAELLTATLLFGLFRVDGARGVLAAALAYLVDALLIVPYALTFPDVVDARGFIGNEQSAAWLWMLWHLLFPVFLVVGRFVDAPAGPVRGRYREIAQAIAFAALTAAAATYVVTSGRDSLPALIDHGTFRPLFTGLAAAASLVSALAAAALASRRGPPTTLSLWLTVALCASALDTGLNGISPARYSFAWYVGKLDTFVTAAVVLLSLLAAWSALYARAALLAQRLRQTLSERRELEDTLERERRVSLALQEASLPRSLPAFDHVAVDAAYHPGNDEATIGGDWYDAFTLDDGRIAVTIGDVMGSGLRAAVTMSKLRAAMQAAAMLEGDPLLMLDVADRTLRLHDPEGYATALALIYDPRRGRATFSSAGHLSPLLRMPDGAISEHPALGTMLGVAGPAARTIESFAVPHGAMIVLYTDGIVEVTRDVIDGQRRLVAAIADARTADAARPAQAIVDRVLGERLATDDIAVLALSFTAHPAASDASREPGAADREA